MCKNENFRNKIIEVANTLKADVVNKADIVLQFTADALTRIVLNATNSANPLPLQRQDAFLVEKIAYYFYNTTDARRYCDDSHTANIGLFYNGKLSFTQKKTKVASNIYLSNFVYRVETQATTQDFNIEKVWQEVVPYWLLSGERDNDVEIEFDSVTPSIPNLRGIVHLQGVLFPNVSKNLT